MQISHVANAGALTRIAKTLSASASGAATSTLVTTPRQKLSTSFISAPRHRQNFVKQRNRSWRGSTGMHRGDDNADVQPNRLAPGEPLEEAGGG